MAEELRISYGLVHHITEDILLLYKLNKLKIDRNVFSWIEAFFIGQFPICT